MPISKIDAEEIMADDRLSPAARELLFTIFDQPQEGDEGGGRWGALRPLLDELQAANYLMRGDAWKSQAGGHLLLFDRSQGPTAADLLPPPPPKGFGRDVLYVIGQPGTAIVKIGVTKNLRTRLRGIQTGSPVPLAVLWWHPGSYDLEEQLHREFGDLRLSGEWFDFGVEEPSALVALAVERLRPEEFPPPMDAGAGFEDYFRTYPPGCRYDWLLSGTVAPDGPLRFPPRPGA